MPITKLDQMFEVLKQKNTKKRIVGVWAIDSHTISALSKAVDLGIVDATLVGDEKLIKKVCKQENIEINKFEIFHADADVDAANKAIDIINSGKSDILMKGLLSTDKYMRAILNKEKGLVPPKGVLSHVTVIENPIHDKLIICGDVAVIPFPDLKQKIAITNYLINTAHALDIEKPKVALLAATEQVLPSMPACVDAAILSKMGDRGQIKGAVLDGPFSFDIAIDKESAQIKGIDSEVAGDADCFLFPNIESGNIFYKTNTKLAGAEVAAAVAGARVPAILSSRSDSVKTKLYSIALGAMLAKKQK
ncbi:MAG: phosphate butyryltransferase [Bacteroidetes bacterium]|nr:MAG: phosphate butyryltransferase [Bacteroidota bacterium]